MFAGFPLKNIIIKTLITIIIRLYHKKNTKISYLDQVKSIEYELMKVPRVSEAKSEKRQITLTKNICL